MDGQYHKIYNFTISQKEMISSWIKDSVERSLWIDGYDLHIDEIISDEVPENVWITISFNLVEFANEEIIRLEYENICPIVFIPLYGDEQRRGVNFKEIFEIENELDVTPPSLFICSTEWEGFITAYLNRQLLCNIEFNSVLYSVYYFEELHTNGLEYVRNISILPKNRI